MAELRLDLPDRLNAGDIRRFIADAGLPVLATAGLSEKGRTETESLLAAARCGASYAELSGDRPLSPPPENFLRELKSRGTRPIISIAAEPGGLHGDCLEDLVGLSDRIRRAHRLVSDYSGLVKLRLRLRSSADARRVMELGERLRDLPDKVLAIEGPFADFARILHRRLGSKWAYIDSLPIAAADEEAEVYGIIGNPVAHSRSPSIHNPWFRGIGRNAVYLPFLVDDVGEFFSMAELIPVRGFSVTVPHKQAVISFLDKIRPAVKKIGACNTVFREDGRWIGENTDYEGFLAPILADIEKGRMRRALVLGAGGAARTAVYALRDNGIAVTIVNRTYEKAKGLAAETGSEALSTERMDHIDEQGAFDLVVQTTSVGMSPDIDGDPLPSYSFSGGETVYDIIYTPPKTRFLERAEKAGCRIIGGDEMLLTQARAQFRLFSGGILPPSR